MMATAFMIPALIERAAIEQARALLAAGHLNGELGPTWPYNVVRHARGCLHAAAGDHAAAVRELLEAGELAEVWGVRNPTLMAWRSDAALSLIALGDCREASRLCAEEIELARRWGASRGLGIALRAAGVAEGGPWHRVAHRGRERAASLAGPAGAGPCADRPRRGAPPGRLAGQGA